MLVRAAADNANRHGNGQSAGAEDAFRAANTFNDLAIVANHFVPAL